VKPVFPYLVAILALLIPVLLAGCSPQAKRVVNLLPPACSQEPDPGYCSAEIPKYYFDRSEGACQEFAWGGCGGFIPFETEQACQQVCLGIEEQAQ
jgi:hypothetical protein